MPAAVFNAVMPLELGPLAACITVSATCLSATCMSANCCVNILTGVGCGSSSVGIDADMRLTITSILFNPFCYFYPVLPANREKG